MLIIMKIMDNHSSHNHKIFKCLNSHNNQEKQQQDKIIMHEV